VPSEERAAKSSERCDLHPGSPSVAVCDGCGRPLCVSCAVPVRGRVLGTECLADALGPDAPPAEAGPQLGPRSARETTAGVAFALAVAATILPWSRFGEGSGPFGAWSRSPRWSLLAAVAAVAGLAAWFVLRRLGTHTPRWEGVLTVLGGLIAAGGLLAALRPPSFTHAWFAPWIAVAAGIGALAASVPRPRGGQGPPERI